MDSEQNQTQSLIIFQKQKDISDLHLQSLCRDSPNITKLFLPSNNITSKGVFIISLLPWTRLILLNLSNNHIGSIGCKHLTKPSLKLLQELDLSHSFITDEGFLHLSKGQWPNLRELQLLNSNISMEVNPGSWKMITTVAIGQSLITKGSEIMKYEQVQVLILSDFVFLARLYIEGMPKEAIRRGFFDRLVLSPQQQLVRGFLHVPPIQEYSSIKKKLLTKMLEHKFPGGYLSF